MRLSLTLGVVLGLGLVGPLEASAFTMGEAMGTAALQGTLAGQSSSGVAGTITGVRSNLNRSTGNYNRALNAALGGGPSFAVAAPGSGGATRWMSTAAGQPQVASQAWVSLGSGPGSGTGWRAAEAFQGAAASQAWAPAGDSWFTGGIIP